MRRTAILNAKEVKRTSFKEADAAFYKHCKLKKPNKIRVYLPLEELANRNKGESVAVIGKITK